VPDDGKIIAFAETCMYEEEKLTENVLACRLTFRRGLKISP
jgi:hypothetical protein